MKLNKENIKKGCPSKLSPQDKRRIISQFEFGKLGNAVQTADFVNSISSIQVNPQTVSRILKKDSMKPVMKKLSPPSEGSQEG